MIETVRYTYRLRPGAQAERALLAEWDNCRWVWNQSVATLRDTGEWVRDHALTQWRADHDWLRAGSSVAQQQTLREFRLKRAKGKGRRKFKSARKTLPSLNYTLRGFSLRGGRLRLPGNLSIPVVWSRDLPSDPTSVRVYRDPLGHWYASFVVRRETPSAPEAGGGIGIDWGIKMTAATTDPAYDLPYLGHRKRRAAELARAQRKMARRRRPRGQAQSRGYRDATRQAAKIQKKAARRTVHDSRVWAKRVVDDHALIAVEDFKPRFLTKSRMARKAADAAIGAAKRELIERGTRAGRKVVLVPPAYTTMTCSGCGTRAKDRLLLSERTFACTSCGLVADRDVNAARVILALAERGQVGADDVRHLAPSPRVSGQVQSEPEILRLLAVGNR